MHCIYPEKVSTLNRYQIFIMFVYIHSTPLMTMHVCTQFDICLSGEIWLVTQTELQVLGSIELI